MVINGYGIEPLSQSRCFDKRSFSAGLLGTKLNHDENYRGEYWLFMDKKHKTPFEIPQGEAVKAKGKEAVLFRCSKSPLVVRGYCKFENEEGCPYVLRFTLSVQVCEAKSFYATVMELLSKNPIWKSRNTQISMKDIWKELDLKECCQKHLGEIGLECLESGDASSSEGQFRKRSEKWLNNEMRSGGLLSKGLQATVLEGTVEVDAFEKEKKDLEKKLEEIRKRGERS